MSIENQPSQTIESPTVDLETYADKVDQKINKEVSPEDREQLAQNIVRLIESDDPAAIEGYFDEALSGREELIPETERAAIFEFLAKEQRVEIGRELLDAGGDMLDRMSTSTDTTLKNLRERLPRTRSQLMSLPDLHQQEVGRHLRQQIDARRALQAHDGVEQTARRVFSGTAEYTGVLTGWNRAQHSEAVSFDGQYQKAQLHQRALREASDSISHDHQGESIDVSSIIDSEVKEATSVKLKQAIEEAKASGESPEAVVAAILNQEEDSTTPKKIVELRRFADQYIGGTKSGVRKVESASAESGEKLRRFATRGREGYQGARRAEDVLGVFQQQKRALSEAVTGMEFTLRQSPQVVEAAHKELAAMKRRLNVSDSRAA